MSEDSAEVAHEALIREWPTLREWLNQDREGLRLQRSLTEAAQDWELLERDSGALYRGARLAQAREWAALHPTMLNVHERAFLEASDAQEQRELREREEQQQREIEAARKLAEAERQRAEESIGAAKKLRRRAVFLASAFILAIIMASAALIFGEQARQKAIDAQAANRIATSRELAAASIANLSDDPERSILLALEAAKQADTFQAQDALHQAVQTSRLLKRVPASANCECTVAFNPDGTRLTTESLDDNGHLTTQVRDAATLAVLFSRPGVLAVDRWLKADQLPIFARDTDWMSTLTVWDAASEQVVTATTLPIRFDDYAAFVDLSPDLTKIAVPKSDGLVHLYDTTTGEEIQRIGSLDRSILRVQFSPDGKSLLTLGEYGSKEVTLWDVVSGRELLTRQTDFPWQIDFSPDGKRFAVNEGQVVRIVDIASGKDMMTLYGHSGFVEGGLRFSADGTRLATEARDGTARIWDVATGQTLLTLPGNDVTTAVALSPDGTQLATVSTESVQTWGIAPTDSREWLTVPAANDWDRMIAFSPDGTELAVYGNDNNVKVLDAQSGQLHLSFPYPTNPGLGLAFSPDGTRLVTSGGDHMAHIWDRATGKELLSLKWHTDLVDRVLFSPDGSRIETISHDHNAVMWDAASGQMLFSMQAYDDNITKAHDVGLVFSPDGSRLATAGGSSVKIWDTLTGKTLLALPRKADLFAYAVAFSPDGKWLAVGYRYGSASVWDVATGQKLFDLVGHTGSVNPITDSLDGTLIATASVDGTTRLWDATTGVEQLTLTGRTGQVAGLAFSPDGMRLATGGSDGTVRVYALRLDDLVKIARSRVTRSLTTAECQRYLHVAECPTP